MLFAPSRLCVKSLLFGICISFLAKKLVLECFPDRNIRGQIYRVCQKITCQLLMLAKKEDVILFLFEKNKKDSFFLCNLCVFA